MAQFEEASPICRGKNLSWETVLLFYNNMPREAMPKAQFNSRTEARINGWTQTHSQIARQLGFYYEKDGICYPRFTKEMSYVDLFKYMQNWAAKYFIPNPYAPSLKGQTPTSVYEFILKAIKSGLTNFDEILDSIFGIKLSSHDKVRVYLNNFTDLVIDGNSVSLNTRTFGMEASLYPDVIYAVDPIRYYEYFNIEEELAPYPQRIIENKLPLQQIFYGAPGTGKSHIIKEQTKGEDVIRTTFHPDTDYSTFVGTYKPTTEFAPVLAIIGDKAVETGREEKRISYEFVCQAFLQAYVAAWKKVAEAKGGTAKKQFLVIEEINRGNCAQIFGDLFQLLDRNDFGYSDYPIKADADMQKQLKWLFEGVEIENAENINALYDGRDIVKKVLSGEELLLPNNLYIWATMNTSDQSLFPIDSAFKRRWDWQYMPISEGRDKNGQPKKWKIEADTQMYSWWSFIQKINDEIYSKINSEDKKLGFYFCKPMNGIIKAETFVSKVLFYLWNDVFKDFAEEAGELFRDDDGSLLTFNKFYTIGMNGKTEVAIEKVTLFLNNLGVKPLAEIDNIEEDDSEAAEGKDYTRYTINGEGSIPKRQLSTQAVRKYIELNPELTPEQVVANWMSLGNIVSHFVETKEQFDARTDNSKRSLEVPCGDTKIYVAWNGWGIGNKMQTLIDSVNNKDWGIKLAIKEA